MLLELTPWIFLMPLIAFPIILFAGSKLPLKGASVGILAMGACFILSSLLVAGALAETLPLPYAWGFPWIRFGMYEVSLGVHIDGLSIVMLFVISLVSLLVQIYSTAYMHGEPYFSRYYAYLSLFTASMLGLVMADNLLVLFACWELVGLCSYFLIGFYFKKPEAAQAGRKAFITTKLGDLGFLLGLFLLFSAAGTFSIVHLQEMTRAGFLSSDLLLAAALLLFCGAMGKSAQIPLFVWLPDAMEGPTPVSALIHAATMVAAGVFLVARVFFIFEANPVALSVVCAVGVLTAFGGALMGLVPEDIKRILAFSTISQLGYMMAGLALGGPQVGMFHLTTHAAFKALLFLGAGSVIHAVHTNDIWKMGGLSVRLPVTFATFAVGVLALSGIFPFSGFFSKDEIVHAAFAAGHAPAGILLTLTSGLTAFYMTRALVLVFLGNSRDREHYAHAHESPWAMSIPLIVLAFLGAFLGGFLHWSHYFERLVPVKLEHSGHHVSTLFVAGITSAAALSGIVLAWLIYKVRAVSHEWLYAAFKPLWHFLYNRMGFDVFWLFCVKAAYKIGDVTAWFDYNLLDQGLVDFFGWLTLKFAELGDWFDRRIVDPLVDVWGQITAALGAVARATVSGLVQSYLVYVVLGVGIIITVKLYF